MILKNTVQVSKSGFTLVELLVVISIIGVLAAVITFVINPLELLRRSRDSNRLRDLDSLSQAINVAMQEGSLSSSSIASILCKESGTYPCVGKSNTGTRITDGNGWVKVNFASQKAMNIPTLPIDPTNNEEFHYTYCADNDTFELDTTLESDKFRSQMAMDGGDTADYYETGSNLNLIANSGGSCEY